MIRRTKIEAAVRISLKRFPVTALLGPRQCGKTTLAQFITKGHKGVYFDLENPLHLARLQNPYTTLSNLKGLIVIDEIQQRKDLLPILRVLSDRRPLAARFLILGSASPELAQKGSESLAGRIHFIEMQGFSLSEINRIEQSRLWLRGGFPKSFLAKSEEESLAWREGFLRTFLERDLPLLGVRIPPLTLRRFWAMTAHSHAQLWNGSDIASSLGIAHTTSRNYLDILTGAYMIRQLSPWFENLGKRTVKAPKVYLRDSGLLHSLLRINSKQTLEESPKFGPSWEGFAIEQILALTGDRDAYFWRTHNGAELDLLLIRNGKRWGFEIKAGEAPTAQRSMHIAKEDLKLSHLWVVYPGEETYSLAAGIDAVPLSKLPSLLTLQHISESL